MRNDPAFTRRMPSLQVLSLTAAALATTLVAFLALSAAAEFIAANPAVALHMARILAQRLHAATAYLADVKSKFADQSNHFAMMDRILDSLMQRQASRAPRPRTEPDPRL